MPSPFPGMDPYLEGYLWPDVHHRLATEISRQLNPIIIPRYVARIVTRMVADFVDPSELGITIYSDVEVIQPPRPSNIGEWSSRLASSPAISEPILELPAPIIVDTPIASVEIRDTAKNVLITSIEILSPTNKRDPGVKEYNLKRARVMKSEAHLLEIDLLRRGTRPVAADDLPDAPYFFFLTRVRYPRLQIWSVDLPDSLPVVPVPLRGPDPDIPLDLGAVMRNIYNEAHYEVTLDYRQEPDVPLAEDDAAWADEWLRLAGLRP